VYSPQGQLLRRVLLPDGLRLKRPWIAGGVGEIPDICLLAAASGRVYLVDDSRKDGLRVWTLGPLWTKRP